MDGTTIEDLLSLLKREIDLDVDQLRSIKTERGGRELSLVITNLQQARLWAEEALKEMGYVDPYQS